MPVSKVRRFRYTEGCEKRDLDSILFNRVTEFFFGLLLNILLRRLDLILRQFFTNN